MKAEITELNLVDLEVYCPHCHKGFAVRIPDVKVRGSASKVNKNDS